MNTCCRLGLILLGLVSISFNGSKVEAQGGTIIIPEPDEGSLFNLLIIDRPSHKPVNEDLAGNLRPEELMARRLSESRIRKQSEGEGEALKELLGRVGDLLNDRVFQSKLKNKGLKQEFEAIRKQFQGENGRLDVDRLKSLIDSMKKNDSLPPGHKDLIKEFTEKVKEFGGTNPGSGQDGPANSRPPDPPGGSSPNRAADSGIGSDPDPMLEKLKEQSADLLRDASRRFLDPNWVNSLMGSSFQKTLRDMALRASEARGGASRFTDRARGLGRYFPRVSNLVPKGLFGGVPQPRLPNMPRLGSLPSAPRIGGMSGTSISGVGKVVIGLAVIGVLCFILWRAGGWWEKVKGTQANAWQLGPWPVRPDDVSTRADLVRAFEHLSLACLGPAARTRHHLDLGAQLGEQPALDRDRRREAAATLSRLYEQARYTPDDEALSPETMACARRELCYLAGAPV